MSERALIVVSLLLVFAPVPSPGAEPRFWELDTSRDFLEGTVEGLSIESSGKLALSPGVRLLADVDLPLVWALARGRDGALFAGTGNEGKVLRLEGGETTPYSTGELEVHALAVGPDGRLYAGSSPDGAVYVIAEDGATTTFYDPPEKYIWGLAFDGEGNLFLATGVEGRLYRVDRDGNAKLMLESAETHLTALVADSRGNVYAGSSPGGIVYRVDRAGQVFVLLDSDYRELKALALGPDGSLYVAGIDGEGPAEAAASPAVQAVPVLATETTVTVTASAPGPAAAPSPAPAPTPTPAPSGGSKGGVIRIHPGGEVETLWTSREDMPQSLAWTPQGCLVGTGDQGRVFLVRDDQTWSMLLTYPGQQVTSMVPGEDGGFIVAVSNPGKVYLQQRPPGSSGTFTSKVQDTGTVSAWGQVRWRVSVPAEGRVEIQTRSGNTGAPDGNWSAWSPVYERGSGSPVTSPSARFAQVRAVLVGSGAGSPTLDSVALSYLQRNLRPSLTSILVHPPGVVFQQPLGVNAQEQILGLGPGQEPKPTEIEAATRQQMPPAITFSRRLYRRGMQTFSWNAADPNGDQLRYDVQYRPAGDARFRLLREGLDDSVLAWDTSTVPNGRYVIRVTATDEPDNPPALALSGSRESEAFEVDNTPPVVEARRSGDRVEVRVHDDTSLIRYAEYSVNGSPWRAVHPKDGICDSLEEEFEIAPERPSGPGPHLFVVRASDRLGNLATAQVELP